MTDDPQIIELESMFMALADRTRLRLLSMMADGEVCVFDFTDALGVSQPKVSRHLAYLRNAGLVSTRRAGKWIYYSINWPNNSDLRSVLVAAITATPAERQAGIGAVRVDSDRYCLEPEAYKEKPILRPVHNELDEFLL